MQGEPLDPQACYAALATRDARFDGRFFVGVSSTGIYCRPTCHSKVPKPENCTFFRTAAEAEAAGYRPCLQCRPETAPGLSPTDAVPSLAQRAARAIEEDPAGIGSLEELSRRLGYTSRHVRRAFEQEYHVSPQQYLKTCRLLLAKNLLTETDLPVAEVAHACGFRSVRRFNDAFVGQYRLVPTALRKRAGGAGTEGAIRVTLGYRPPYEWGRMLGFLAARAIPGVEAVETASANQSGSYARAVRLPAHDGRTAEGWICVTHHPRRDALVLEAADALAPALPQVIARVKDLFDLRCDPDAIATHLAGMSELDARLPIAGLRVPGCFEPFEMAVRAVLGQQITVKAATTLAGRLAERLGTPVETPFVGIDRVFPGPESLLALGDGLGDTLGQLGITRQRQRTIRALAEGFADGTVATGYGMDPRAQMVALLAMPGIGDWTANYLAMRMLRWTDAFPGTDLGVKKALAPRTPREIQELSRAWSPWRAYSTMNLWGIE